jgi:hypothetical protein
VTLLLPFIGETVWNKLSEDFSLFQNFMKHMMNYICLNVQLMFMFVFVFSYALQPFKAYCASWIRHANFCHQASPCLSPRESTQWQKVQLWARSVR